MIEETVISLRSIVEHIILISSLLSPSLTLKLTKSRGLHYPPHRSHGARVVPSGPISHTLPYDGLRGYNLTAFQ